MIKKNTFYKANLITSSKTIRQKKFSNKYSSKKRQGRWKKKKKTKRDRN